MKFKLFAILFALVFSAGIISHETSHFEMDHGEHAHNEHNEHAVELTEDCSTCLAEQIEYVQDDTVVNPTAIVFDFLDAYQSSEITLSYNQLSIRAPPRN